MDNSFAARERVPPRRNRAPNIGFHFFYREFRSLRDLERSIARVFVWEWILQYQFAVFVILGTNSDTKTDKAVLRSALRFTEQRPFQLVVVNGDQPSNCALTSFLLTMHHDRPHSSMLIIAAVDCRPFGNRFPSPPHAQILLLVE